MPFWKGCNRHVEYVDQRHQGLERVPDDIHRYARSLEELLLDANHIKDLPKVVGTFLEICVLALSDGPPRIPHATHAVHSTHMALLGWRRAVVRRRGWLLRM